MERLKYIKSTDDIKFEYNYKALNACFGANMQATLQEAIWNSGDGCLVWFPHLAKEKDGKYIAGSAETNWKNYFENDGKVIIEMLYPGEMVNDDMREPTLSFGPDIMPMHTFMKMDVKDYRYVGTFMLDYNESSLRYHVARMIKDGIDLSVWESGHDMNYYDYSEIGRDVFKSFYIDNDFRKQKKYIESFLQEYSCNAEDEFKDMQKEFVTKYSYASFITMGEEQFINSFIPELNTVLGKIFNKEYETISILANLSNYSEFGRNLFELVNNKEKSINDRIRSFAYGEELASALFTLYGENGYGYLYTLDENIIDNIFYALGIKNPNCKDRVAKQSELYFWRQCDDIIIEWSIYKYWEFLNYLTKQKKKSIQYIAAPREDVKKSITSEVDDIDEIVNASDLEDAPKDFKYNSTPRVSEIKENPKVSKGGKIVPRHIDRKINALVRAGFSCEINKEHVTFKRRNSDKDYTETHHLIPIEYSAEFQYTLDTEENIVSLCSNCHNQIHYGAGAEELLKKLYEERKEALEAAGLGETKKGVKMDFVQLLHMYRLD